jgi:hypothetical protein
MPTYPSPKTWEHASERQAQRAIRSFGELRRRSVPIYQGPLLVEDDNEVTLQPAQEVARRVMVLWAVELRAEGIPQKESLEIIDQLDIWNSVSPKEKRFLQDDNPSPNECHKLIWRLESIWILLWVLRLIEKLNWPSGT